MGISILYGLHVGMLAGFSSIFGKGQSRTKEILSSYLSLFGNVGLFQKDGPTSAKLEAGRWKFKLVGQISYPAEQSKGLASMDETQKYYSETQKRWTRACKASACVMIMP